MSNRPSSGFIAWTVLLVAAGGFCHSGTLQAQQPIPADVDALSQRDVEDLVLAYHKRTIIDAFDRHGAHDPNWNEAVDKFLRLCTKRFSLPWIETSLDEQLDLGRAAVEAGCDDPLLSYLLGRTLLIGSRHDEALLHLQQRP